MKDAHPEITATVIAASNNLPTFSIKSLLRPTSLMTTTFRLRHHPAPAVHHQHLAGDEAGVAHEEQRGAGDVLRFAGALERRARDDALLGHLVHVALRPEDGAGGEGVDPDLGAEV